MRFVLAATLIGFIAGCASRPPTVPLESLDDQWSMREEALQRLPRWEFSGRVSIAVEDQGWHATLDWKQQDNSYEIDLSGPLGQGRLVIAGSPGGVRARSADGQVVVAKDAESLIAQRLGWTLPVAGLRYWVRGIPDPEWPVQSMTVDSLGRLATLRQDGWRIQYPAYVEGPGLDLPRKLRLERDRIDVRLVIDQWSDGNPGAAGIDPSAS